MVLLHFIIIHWAKNNQQKQRHNSSKQWEDMRLRGQRCLKASKIYSILDPTLCHLLLGTLLILFSPEYLTSAFFYPF